MERRAGPTRRHPDSQELVRGAGRTWLDFSERIAACGSIGRIGSQEIDMPYPRYVDAKSRLDQSEFAGPASDEMIRAAEARLGLPIPASFRYFLSQYGAALCSGFEIAGIYNSPSEEEPPLWEDFVVANQQLRRGAGVSLPKEYLYFSDDGQDYKYFLDTTRQSADGDCPVIAIGPGIECAEVAAGFFDFVVRAYDGTLDYAS